MSPEPSGALAFHAAGGAVMSRGGRDVTVQAASLQAFYQQEAIERRRVGDGDGAAFCERMQQQLSIAVRAADDWRRAAGPGRSSLAGFTRLTRDLSHRPDG